MGYHVEIVNTKKGMQDFIMLPHRIYSKDPNWIAPVDSEILRVLNEKKNPYFESASLDKFVCYRNNEPVARAVIVINSEYWKRWNQKTAFFGFYEAIYDQEATTQLFSFLETYCLQKGAEYLEGPFNPNHYSEIGILSENFDMPQFFETYNPKWYKQRLLNIGFTVKKSVFTRINPEFKTSVAKMNNRIHVNGRAAEFHIRYFNLLRFRRDIETMRNINNDAFSDNPYFLPLSSREYRFASKFMFLITSPKLITFIEYNNKPVGVMQAVYNVNPAFKKVNSNFSLFGLIRFLVWRNKTKEVIIYSAGIKKEYRKTIAAHLIYQSICNLSKKFNVVATTWMSDDNPLANRSVEKLGMKPYKWFVILSKKLANEQ